ESSDYVDDYEVLTDEVDDDLLGLYKIPNEKDDQRVFHTYDKWECHKAGFYASVKEGMTHQECEQAYKDILTNIPLFENILDKVINEWTNSCEHYLSNKAMNRIAWLGQACVCYHSGVPSRYANSWFDLTEEQQNQANYSALKALNKWLKMNDRSEIEISEAASIGRQTELY